VLAAKVSARESAVAWDSATFHVKDVEDWVALAEKEALERVSKAEAENATVLATASKDTEGLARKVTLLEDELAAEHWAQEMSQREH
jgi:7-keto-8-aminopelargonate synthetase-like enzyme